MEAVASLISVCLLGWLTRPPGAWSLADYNVLMADAKAILNIDDPRPGKDEDKRLFNVILIPVFLEQQGDRLDCWKAEARFDQRSSMTLAVRHHSHAAWRSGCSCWLPILTKAVGKYWVAGYSYAGRDGDTTYAYVYLHKPGPRPPGPPCLDSNGKARSAAKPCLSKDDYRMMEAQVENWGTKKFKIQVLDERGQDMFPTRGLSVTFDHKSSGKADMVGLPEIIVLALKRMYDCGLRYIKPRQKEGNEEVLVKLVHSSLPPDYPVDPAVLLQLPPVPSKRPAEVQEPSAGPALKRCRSSSEPPPVTLHHTHEPQPRRALSDNEKDQGCQLVNVHDRALLDLLHGNCDAADVAADVVNFLTEMQKQSGGGEHEEPKKTPEEQLALLKGDEQWEANMPVPLPESTVLRECLPVCHAAMDHMHSLLWLLTDSELITSIFMENYQERYFSKGAQGVKQFVPVYERAYNLCLEAKNACDLAMGLSALKRLAELLHDTCGVDI